MMNHRIAFSRFHLVAMVRLKWFSQNFCWRFWCGFMMKSCSRRTKNEIKPCETQSDLVTSDCVKFKNIFAECSVSVFSFLLKFNYALWKTAEYFTYRPQHNARRLIFTRTSSAFCPIIFDFDMRHYPRIICAHVGMIFACKCSLALPIDVYVCLRLLNWLSTSVIECINVWMCVRIFVRLPRYALEITPKLIVIDCSN